MNNIVLNNPVVKSGIIRNVKILRALVLLFITIYLSFNVFECYALSIETQRKTYQQAKAALNKGKIQTFNTLSESITDYPLYPYLRYNYLYPRVGKVADNEIKDFLNSYSDFPSAQKLHIKWLKYLARNKRWQIYSENYTIQNDIELQCYQLQARIETNQNTFLLEDIRSVWLNGDSLPSQCDPAFALLYKSDLMTNELIWERIRLVMANGKPGLATYLSKKLENFYAEWAVKWLQVDHNPDKWTKDPDFENIAIAYEILVYGIQKLAKININRAITNWEQLKTKYDFTPQQISETNRILAVRAATKKHPLATTLLDNIHNLYVNDDVFHWRLILALENYDWNSLKKWTSGVPPYEDISLRWNYWHARALEQTGDTENAHKIFANIATQRDYYGFLAADRIGVPYKLNHTPLPNNADEIRKIATLPGISRASELLALKETTQARREWHHALNHMTSYQKEMAAIIAKNWGWLDRAIFTMGSARSYDDLVLRFPLRFKEIIDENLAKNHLDPGWVYALIRSESAFMEDARSPVGALGLMQVMPQTGKETAKSLGWKKFKKNDLLVAEKNIPIGSAYLKQMLNRFKGNKVLATAAYNAGPHRVKQWLPKSDCVEPDIWVEKIAFNETRKYVRRVLFYASIYDWRLENEITSIKQRMATIIPDKDQQVAGLSCAGQKISFNSSL